MTLSTGDFAALTGMVATISSAVGIITRYYVKNEVRTEVNKLRLELKQERLDVLESRVMTGHVTGTGEG